MEALKLIPGIVLLLCIGGIIAGAASLTLGEFKNTMDKCATGGYSYNASWNPGNYGTCYNGTTVLGLNGSVSDQYKSVIDSQAGISNVTEQFATVAIIAVMVIIISLIAGVFVYMKMF